MQTLSPAVIEHKNSLSSVDPILYCLEIVLPSAIENIKIVNNNEDIVWAGSTWQAFPFKMESDIAEQSGEVQQVSISVANASRVMQRYLMEYDLWLKLNPHQNITVKIHIISTADLSNTTPIRMFEFKVNSFSTNAYAVKLNLSQDNIYMKRFPPNRITRRCRWKFGSIECGYTPAAGETCDKSLSACRSFNNSTRFGGFPSVGNKLEKVVVDA